MSDRTNYLVEVYDPAWGYPGNIESNWTPTESKAYDTFPEAEKAATKAKGVFRSVRITKLVRTTAAEYQDGVPVG